MKWWPLYLNHAVENFYGILDGVRVAVCVVPCNTLSICRVHKMLIMYDIIHPCFVTFIGKVVLMLFPCCSMGGGNYKLCQPEASTGVSLLV